MSHVRSRAATNYSGGTTTTASSVKGYSSTLRKSRILVFSLLYHVQHQILPLTSILRNIVLVLEMLQVVSLALEPAFTDFGRHGLNEGLAYFGRIRMPMPALASPPAHTASIVVLIVYLSLILLSGVKLALMEEGTIPPPPYWLRAWGLLSVSFHQILYLPALSILFSAMHCGIVHYMGNPDNSLSGLRDTFHHVPTAAPNHTYSSNGFTYSYDYISSESTGSNDDRAIFGNVLCEESQSIAYLVLTTVFLCVTIFYFGVLAFAEYGFEQRRRDKRNLFSHTLSRLSFFLFLVKTCATLYVQFSGDIALETRAGLYQWVIMLCFAGLIWYICKFVPFYHRLANVAYLALFVICFIGALISFVTTRTTNTLSAFIAFMVLLVPIIAGAFFVIYFRLRSFYKPRNQDKDKEFCSPFEVEIISRPAIEDNISKDRIRSIYWRGLKQFPDNWDVQLAFMQYLIEDTDNFQMLTSTMEKVKKIKSKMQFDTKFLLHCIEKQRMSLALAMDGGVEEVSKILLNANHHAHRAKLLVKNFWESLLHEEDLMLMPNMVAKLEHEETTADRAFMKLRARFPQNVAVMRHYAQFLDEVKGDPDTAQELYKLAEDTEHETSTSHIGRGIDTKTGSDSLGPASGKIIGEDVNLEEIKKKDKEKERSGGNVTPDYEGADTFKPRQRIKRLQLDSGSDFVAEDSPRKSSGILSSRAYSPPPLLARDANNQQVPPKKISKYDMFRFRQYRDQAELFKSHSVWKISSAINLTLLILLLNMVILFGATMAVLKAQTDSITQLSDMVDTRQNVALCISSTLRALRYTATNDSSSFDADVSTTLAAISYLSNNTLKMYGRSESYKPVREGWSDTKYDTYIWSFVRQQTSGNGYIQEQLSILDMITGYTFWMQQSAGFIIRPNGVDSLWNSTGGRYVLENGLTTVTDGVTKLVDLYEQKGKYTVSILQKITITLLPLSFFLVVLLLWVLVRSAIREIQHERVTILKLFLAIPKDNILSIVSSFKSELREGGMDEEDEDLFAANEDEVSNFDSTVDMAGDQNLAATVWMAKNSRLSMLRNFFLKFLISLLSGFFLVVIAAALILAAIPEFNANIRSINIAGQRRTLVSHLHSACMTLAYYSETTRSYPNNFNSSQLYLTPPEIRTLINDDIELIMQADSILKFGTDGASGIQGHPYLIDLAYNQPCSPLIPYSYTCTGMNSLLVYVIALAQIVNVIPDTQLSFLSSQLQTLSDVSYKQLSPMLGQAVSYYRKVAADKVNEVSTSIIAIFVVIFPVLLAVNFVLRPMVIKVKQEHKRTLRMLLMIPIGVIDTTPSIKEYLDSLSVRRARVPWWKLGMLRGGWHKEKRRGSSKSEQLLQSHEPLLQAFGRDADEALLVVSVEGTIEVVSLSTERILGYEKRQLIGHRIASLFDEKTNDYVLDKCAQLRHQETAPVREISRDLHAKNGSGDYIPVGITISSLKVNSKMYFGLFIKDISLFRSIESQMEKERAIVSAEQTKLKELLLNVFPKSIAEQLMIKGEGSYQPQLIAEEYKEATILFADIVGFTTMCSDLEPGALLLILDGIFTQWDALIEKYKLQKIKTIGDCFMAAGGVPDRTVDHAERIIDFAMEMTATLHRYNDTCQILKSRSLTLNIRIGINTGPVVAGIIGRSRMCFDLWGDAVNVASRMESTSLVGRIQVSQATFNRLKNNYQFEERGSIEVKGKGGMLTYLLVAPRFYRTESGKVIDNRFAQHLYSTPSGKSQATNSSANTPATDYSPALISPLPTPNTNLNISGNSTPTINLTNSSNVGQQSIAEYNRNNRRSSLGTAPNLSAFSSYNTNNNTTNNNNNNNNNNNQPTYHGNRRGSASTASSNPTTTIMRPIFETGEDNTNYTYTINSPVATAFNPNRDSNSHNNNHI